MIFLLNYTYFLQMVISSCTFHSSFPEKYHFITKNTFKHLHCPLALLNAISHYKIQSTIGLLCPEKSLYIKYSLKLSSSNTSTKRDKQSQMEVTTLQCELFTIKQDFFASKSVINRWLPYLYKISRWLIMQTIVHNPQAKRAYGTLISTSDIGKK